MRYIVNVNGKQFDVQMERVGERAAAPILGAVVPSVQAPVVAKPMAPVTLGVNHEVVSPMPGSVLDIKVEVGQQVNEGELLVVLEAMKMEIEVNASASGTVKQILTNIGSSVGAEDVLIVIS